MFSRKTAEIFIPDGELLEDALVRTTHLGIGAHQDDLEIMAYSGIVECFQKSDKWFSGVVVTDGSGSPREDLYIDYTDEQMRSVRRKEQKKAAYVGEYSFQILLDHPSSSVKDNANKDVSKDLVKIFTETRPEVVYTHNLADKHPTHVGVAVRVLQAIRSLDIEVRPKALYGCEVWRDLDWMIDSDKVVFDTSPHENLQFALLGVFDSQISGGKRYDLATMGRRKAHATYFESHGVDQANGINFAMDLTPLIRDENLKISDYLEECVLRFLENVKSAVSAFEGR